MFIGVSTSLITRQVQYYVYRCQHQSYNQPSTIYMFLGVITSLITRPVQYMFIGARTSLITSLVQ